MFFKVLFYILGILVLIAVLGKTNYNTSLYKKESNIIEFIFPIWNWGTPWFYARYDSNGLELKIPDDIKYRYALFKVEEQTKKKDIVCKEQGMNSEACENEEIALEDLQIIAEEEKEFLEDIIAEKGEDVRLSPNFEKEEFSF
ncbi:MAG: hypothetical protein ACI4V7_04600 [Succinivibrionaceae bacterium]